MQVPSLPTDNLYKFMALFGLVLLVSTIAIYLLLIGDLYSKVDKLQSDTAVLKVDIEFTTDEMKQWRAAMKQQMKIADKHLAETYAKELRSQGEKIISEARSHAIKLAELDRKGNALTRLNNRVFVVNLLMMIPVGVSIVLIILGFSLWYKRVQVHLDKELAEKSKR